MKVLIVMSGFLPGKKYGGPPVSVNNFCSLMDGLDCYIVALNHDFGETEKYSDIHDGWNDRGNCNVRYLSDAQYGKKEFEIIINELRPDVIYLQSFFQSCVIPCLSLAKKYKITVLLAPRGELCNGALNIKRRKKTIYIYALRFLGMLKNLHFQSTSDEETDAVKRWANTDDSHVHRLDNIPTVFDQYFCKKEKTSGEGRFVFISRLHPKKNLLFAINCFHEIKQKAIFDIYGPVEDESYWEKCREAIKELPPNITVYYKGSVSHDQVGRVLSQYDAFIFPTLSENYGHVIAEAILCNCPPIISKSTTPWDEINEKVDILAYSLDDRDGFVSAIDRIISMNGEDYNQLITKLESYSKEKIRTGRIAETYNELLCGIAEKTKA